MKRFLSCLFLLPTIALAATSFTTNKTSESRKILNTDGTIYHDLTKSEVTAYYDDLNLDLTGDDLLSNLQYILKQSQTKLKYTSGDTSSTAWNGYYLFERDYELSPLEENELSGMYKKTKIYLNSLYCDVPIYINAKINNGNFTYNDGSDNIDVAYKNGSVQFDREHVFPKSFGLNDADNNYQNFTSACDVHNLHIGEHNANSSGHNNYPYGNVADKENLDTTTVIKNGITGEINGYLGLNEDGIKVFEPNIKDKGDIARSIFYMCARYHTYEMISPKDESPSLALSNNVTNTSTIAPNETKTTPATYGILKDLLEWNKIDPVDKFECHRNNLIYNAIQHNRNPFIDCPDWADACFDEAYSGDAINFNNISQYDNLESVNYTKYSKITPEIIKPEGFKENYYLFDPIDFSTLKIKITEIDKDNNEFISETSEFTTYLDGKEIPLKYQISKLGTVSIILKYEYKSKAHQATLKVGVSLSPYQLGFLIIGTIVALIIIIIISVYFNYKKTHKKPKFNENKTLKNKQLRKLYKKNSKF